MPIAQVAPQREQIPPAAKSGIKMEVNGVKIMAANHNKCPYCSSVLLRHARQKGVYWFCTSCWQEIPTLLTNTPTVRETLGGRSHVRQTINS